MDEVFVIQYHPIHHIGRRGFTMVELMISVAIIGILAGIAVPSYRTYAERTKQKKAIGDITIISMEIDKYVMDNGELPPDLASVPGVNFFDPWGNPYRYLNITTEKGKGKMRKNRFMVPINSDFDLYSMGEDGKSVSPLTAKSSRDDIIRANDGQYVGLAAHF